MPRLPDDYQTRSADDKTAILWENLAEQEYPDNALPKMSFLKFVTRASTRGLFSVSFLKKSFLYESDELPPGRRKIVHPFGSVCRVRFESLKSHPLTGLLYSGGPGLIRIGRSLPSRSFTPGIAVKFMVSGRPSCNVVCIPNLEGQGDNQNVFARPASTVLPPFHGLVLGMVKIMFTIAVKQIPSRDLSWNKIPVNHLAETNLDGTRVDNPVIPDELVFQPTADCQTSSASEPDYRLKLKAIPSGSVLFDVLARVRPGEELQPIGRLVSDSRFIASPYGDQVLFFQHNVGHPPT